MKKSLIAFLLIALSTSSLFADNYSAYILPSAIEEAVEKLKVFSDKDLTAEERNELKQCLKEKMEENEKEFLYTMSSCINVAVFGVYKSPDTLNKAEIDFLTKIYARFYTKLMEAHNNLVKQRFSELEELSWSQESMSCGNNHFRAQKTEKVIIKCSDSKQYSGKQKCLRFVDYKSPEGYNFVCRIVIDGYTRGEYTGDVSAVLMSKSQVTDPEYLQRN